MGSLYRLDFASGKSYVGITENAVIYRFKQHTRSVRRGEHTLLWDTWRKLGPPQLVILAILENFMLPRAEQLAIIKFGTLVPCGYNMTPGGEISPTSVPEIAAKLRGQKRSPEVCAKLKISRHRWKPTPDHVANLAAANRGKKRSPETKARISAALLAGNRERFLKFGNCNPMLSERLSGKPLAAKHREAIAAAMRRPGIGAKISAGRRRARIIRDATKQLSIDGFNEPLPGWETGEY